MKTVSPEPFTFEGGDRAVLLLHGFTGNTADVRMLGRFLESNGYTVHAPLYKGHGSTAPENLIQSTNQDWWESVMEGYNLIKNKGYKKIAVAGLSLGGLFSLKLAANYPVVGILPMCAPLGFAHKTTLRNMILSYALEQKMGEGKSDDIIEKEMEVLKSHQSINAINGLNELIKEVKESLPSIQTPTFVIQGRQDQIIDMNSPTMILNQIYSKLKKLKWYEKSGHLITIGDERNKLEEDVLECLDTLSWGEDDEIGDISTDKVKQIWW
ncbi:alpha/beta hydrolase [Aquibacillus albus]|uniref:Carboxylesterase n=1 Tax=Aquibacillus albus TaxID=1168171 RepID=A0ABS2N550_9BACI|nr:alpha/beta fold hydrolase [Aquibacillus albus]MBM7573275.1 carboxylesterase [Aquibacillus albus]